MSDIDIEAEEATIVAAAREWAKVRRAIFAKDKTEISDWTKLGDAEYALMRALK